MLDQAAYTAQDLREPYSRIVGQWQILGLLVGALLDAFRAGQEPAFSVARDALIVADTAGIAKL